MKDSELESQAAWQCADKVTVASKSYNIEYVNIDISENAHPGRVLNVAVRSSPVIDFMKKTCKQSVLL